VKIRPSPDAEALNGSSRMRGNHHVRFLGGEVGATRPLHPSSAQRLSGSRRPLAEGRSLHASGRCRATGRIELSGRSAVVQPNMVETGDDRLRASCLLPALGRRQRAAGTSRPAGFGLGPPAPRRVVSLSASARLPRRRQWALRSRTTAFPIANSPRSGRARARILRCYSSRARHQGAVPERRASSHKVRWAGHWA
jgi:hypothetical protein